MVAQNNDIIKKGTALLGERMNQDENWRRKMCTENSYKAV